jgi:fermentation-respiration switch protein FrsA (DUF1100 family)
MSHDSFDENRRKFLSTSMIAASGAVAAGLGLLTPRVAASETGIETPEAVLQAVIGYPNEKGVQIQRVTYPNRSAQTLIAANLFIPSGVDRSKKYAGIVVGHPFGGVKEQTAGVYALRLAEMGFVTVAFDASHYGDSSGEPRHIEVPSTRVEDYSAGVDFLSNHPLVDENRVGVLGICGGGGYSVSAAQIDHRIRAIATVSMYDMGRARRQGLGDTIPYEQRMKTLDEIGRQRTREARGEPRRDIRALPTEPPNANTPPIVREFLDYYDTPRGHHPNSTGWYSFTSLAPMMNFFPFVQIETISPRPILIIAGERAESAYFSQDAYSKAAQPKEIFIVPSATHVDLYDRPQCVGQAVERLTKFYGQYLT